MGDMRERERREEKDGDMREGEREDKGEKREREM